MQIRYPEIGICGLSCRLCPTYQTTAKSRCGGCKSEYRMSAGCPFITCAIKKKGIEFCWFCKVNNTCEKWSKHKQASKNHDSFKCYQTLETDIEFIKTNGIENFINNQKIRERLLIEMLSDFNEGRSKSYYCIAATVLQIEELEKALSLAKKEVNHQTIVDIREKSKTLHSILDNIANENNYLLKLRK
jgi:hypothetical protein